MRTLILGCGYVGRPLAALLAGQEDQEVFGASRSTDDHESLRELGVTPVVADVTKPETLEALPGPFDWVVNTVSSSKGGADTYREVYLEGTRNLLKWLESQTPTKYVWTSSSSVYGQTDGSLIKEHSETEPTTETSRILVETEKLLLDAAKEKAFPAVILRVAGIYGPERGHLFLQYLKDEAKITGKPERLLNMIHVDDVVGIIEACLKGAKGGEIYNAVDEEPAPQVRFFRFLSETLGKPMPPKADPEEPTKRKRALTNKKVSNRKLLMELGYQFKYPNFRKGYTAEIIRLQRSGVLDFGL